MQERLDREQPGEQRYKNHTNNGYTSASHELLHALRFYARVKYNKPEELFEVVNDALNQENFDEKSPISMVKE